MKLGLCAPLSRAQDVQSMGYDYIEPGLSALAALPEEAFEEALAGAKTSGLPVEAANQFVPAALPLVGPEVDKAAVQAYVEGALRRASALGVQVVVFGSGGARQVPAGFSHDGGLSQVAEFLRLCNPIADANGLRIAIEPLCQRECNLLNTVMESTALARLLRQDAIGVLGDTYHMFREGEPFSSFSKAGGLLLHVHVANPQGRLYPRPGDGYDYAALFDALHAAGYDGRVSVEVGEDAFDEGAPAALEVLRPFIPRG